MVVAILGSQMLKAKLLTVLLLSSMNAFSADWYFIGGNTEVATFYERNTVFKKDGQASVWIRKVYRTPVSGRVKAAEIRMHFACSKSTYQIGSLQAFTESYQPYGTPMDFSEQYVNVVKLDPETTDQVAYDIGCRSFKSDGNGPFIDSGTNAFAEFWFERQKK